MTNELMDLIQMLVRHEGACSIPSGGKLHRAAEELVATGLVTMHESPTVGWMEIHLFNFQGLKN